MPQPSVTVHRGANVLLFTLVSALCLFPSILVIATPQRPPRNDDTRHPAAPVAPSMYLPLVIGPPEWLISDIDTSSASYDPSLAFDRRVSPM
jgi:hypothetical protein